MNRIIPAILIIVVVTVLVSAGTLAYFSDVEKSTDNIFTAGWLDLKVAHPPTPIVTTYSPTVKRTYSLHPIAGIDATDSYTLTEGDLDKLSNSDDQRYDSKNPWETTFSDNEYIEVLFPKIPSAATVSSVKIKVEWARQEKVNAARLKVYDGATWTVYPLNLAPAPTDKWGADTMQEVDISAFINTAEKVNALKVWFQATVSEATGDRKTRHDLMELTVTYTINVLHPNAGKDTTKELYTLTDDDLIMLAVSDDYRYINQKDWKESFDNKYIELEFPDVTIPSGAVIDSVVLKFEWQRTAAVDNAQLKIYVGSSLIATISLTPLPLQDTDRTEIIDLKGNYGIDTEAEINALKIWFQATDGRGAKTQHDWVEVQVTYTITTIPEPEWSDGVVNTIGMTNMKPGDSASGKILLKQIGTITATSLGITCDYTVTEEDPQTEADTDPDTNLHPDQMAKAMKITELKYLGTDRLEDLPDIDGGGKTLFDLKHAGLVISPPNLPAEFEIEITFDPVNANDFQGDTFHLTMIFTLKQ